MYKCTEAFCSFPYSSDNAYSDCCTAKNVLFTKAVECLNKPVA